MEQAARDKFIFITGAASGIGRATAKLFAERGWFVGCFDRNAEALAALKEELGAETGLFLPLDVTDRAALIEAVGVFDEASRGRLDLLFSNAGIDAKGPFADMAWDKIVAIVEINLLGSEYRDRIYREFLEIEPPANSTEGLLK